jgi:hypothetical protein
MNKADNDVILWALICAAYHLQKLDADETDQLQEIRKLLSEYSPATVSLYFPRAAITFNPPESLDEAQALYEHYGVDASGLEKHYPAGKPQ